MHIRREKLHSRYTVALYTRPLSHWSVNWAMSDVLYMLYSIHQQRGGRAEGRNCDLINKLSPDPDEKMSLSHSQGDVTPRDTCRLKSLGNPNARLYHLFSVHV